MRTRVFSDEGLRAMYAGGQANAAARRFARFWSGVFRLGLLPRRWVTLEVTGRRSGRTRRFPLGMADWEEHWYLVPMLGERCNWVRNVRAADGRAVLRRGRAVRCTLVELPEEQRPAILRRYLQKVPGARPHMPVGPDAPLADFAAVAARYPVFLVVPDRPGRGSRRRRWTRRILAGAATLLALVVLASWAFIKFQPTLSSVSPSLPRLPRRPRRGGVPDRPAPGLTRGRRSLPIRLYACSPGLTPGRTIGEMAPQAQVPKGRSHELQPGCHAQRNRAVRPRPAGGGVLPGPAHVPRA